MEQNSAKVQKMFKSFFEKRRQQKEIRDFANSKIGQLLKAHNNQYFSNSMLSSFSQAAQEDIQLSLTKTIFETLGHENPALHLREMLVNATLSWAQFQILCLTEEEKLNQSYKDSPYISGSLHTHIRVLSKHVSELDQFIWANPETTDQEIITVCNARAVVNLYIMNGLNILRVEFADIVEGKDWFQPFCRSCLIWEEYQFRERLGLPNLLPSATEALKHSMFANFVVNGHVNPYYEWERAANNE